MSVTTSSFSRLQLLSSIEQAIHDAILVSSSLDTQIKTLESQLNFHNNIISPAMRNSSQVLHELNNNTNNHENENNESNNNEKSVENLLTWWNEENVKENDNNNNNIVDNDDPVKLAESFVYQTIEVPFQKIQQVSDITFNRLIRVTNQMNTLNNTSSQISNFISKTCLEHKNKNNNHNKNEIKDHVSVNNKNHSKNKLAIQQQRIQLQNSFEDSISLEQDEEGAAMIQLVQGIISSSASTK